MESKKCHECGLVNWVDSETLSCKRCGGPIWQKADYSLGLSSKPTESQLMFTGLVKIVAIVLGVAMLGLLVSRVLSLTGTSTGKVLGVVFILVGLVFAIVIKVWFLAAVFGESVGWGLASIFLPFGALVALIKFWDKTQRPFVAHLISMGIIVVGVLTGVFE